MGPKFSVLCHTATESLVSHHGLRKYWHFVFFYERSLTLHIQAKGVGGGKNREGAKSLVSKTTD